MTSLIQFLLGIQLKNRIFGTFIKAIKYNDYIYDYFYIIQQSNILTQEKDLAGQVH